MALEFSTTRRDLALAFSKATDKSRSSLAPINDNEPGARSVNASLADCHPLAILSSRGEYLPARAFISSARPFIHATKLTLGRVVPFGDQLLSQSIADLDHLSIVLSKASSFAGSTNASKRGQELGKVIQGRGRFIQGAAHDD